MRRFCGPASKPSISQIADILIYRSPSLARITSNFVARSERDSCAVVTVFIVLALKISLLGLYHSFSAIPFTVHRIGQLLPHNRQFYLHSLLIAKSVLM